MKICTLILIIVSLHKAIKQMITNQLNSNSDKVNSSLSNLNQVNRVDGEGVDNLAYILLVFVCEVLIWFFFVLGIFGSDLV